MLRATRRSAQPPAPPRDSLIPPPPPPTQQFSHRDSDISHCSSRPSSSSFNLPRHQQLQITDHSYKQSAVRSINAYLSSHNFPISLSLKPLPSAKDLTQTLQFLLTQLNYSLTSNKLEDDLVIVLKFLNCPHKINKSAFRAPGAPHSFPLLLAVIHWLVQLAGFVDHLSSDENTSGYSFRKDSITVYTIDSYLAYMKGDDEAVNILDEDLMKKTEQESGLLVENLTLMDEEVKELEGELEGLKSKPSEKETCESKRKEMEADLEKFQDYVANLQLANSETMKGLEKLEKKLAAKSEEIRLIQEENEELKKRADEQGINIRDAERMKRELMSVEREISEAEASQNSWDEKCWDLNAAIGQKLKEVEALSIECNQALRRLKLGGDFQYVLNAKGSSPAEVFGINYKSTLKPAIKSFAEEIKKTTTAKLDEFIALQQQSKDMAAKIEAKRNCLAVLQSHVDDQTRQIETMRKEIDEYSSWCASVAENIVGDVEAEVCDLDNMEREASETVKAAELKLQEETTRSEQETQLCAYELFALIDSVSRYKEHVENKISEMRKDLCETTEFISGSYKNTLSGHLSSALGDEKLPNLH